MGKIIRRILMIILLLVFLGSVGMIGTILYQYHKIDQLHEAAVVQYTKAQEAERPAQAEPVASGAPVDAPEAIIAPIMVDFEGLRAINPEVVGWIYCEGTGINYPVMQGENNDYYLTHSYDGAYNVSGSIFVEAENRAGFADRNTIIYGHNMKNDSMFAHLDNWAEPGYYEEHPVIWLLTPEQDYQIELMAGYTTSAYSDTYVIFPEPGEELVSYLRNAAAQSDFQSAVTVEADGHYVLLSTCAYVFDNARYVLHGKLVAADSAGGEPFAVS